MERNQFWMFTGVGLVFALAIAIVFHDSPVVNQKLGKMVAQFDALEVTGMLSGIDAHVGRITGAATRTKKINPDMTSKVEGALARLRSGSTESTPLFQGKKKEDPKVAATAAAAKLAQAKKLAALKKKKAKKKVKRVGGPNIIGVEAPQDPTEESDASDLEVAQDQTQTRNQQVVAVAPPEKEETPKEAEEIPQTEAEWAALVLREPDYKNTEKLVKYYQGKLVKAAVFYAVVEKMLLDSRPKMQQFGVMALTATPSNKSFEALAEYIHADTGDAAMKTQAQNSLKRYAQSYVAVLGSVLSSTQSNASAVEAHRMLRLALENVFKAQETPGSVPTAASVAQINYYRNNFLPLLQRLETTYQDAELKSELAQTLATFNTYIPDDVNAPTATASVN